MKILAQCVFVSVYAAEPYQAASVNPAQHY